MAVGAAALVAGLTIPLGPSGILVLAPVLACTPRIRRLLGGGSWVQAVVRVGLVAVVGAVAVAVVFADQTRFGVVAATELHSGFGEPRQRRVQRHADPDLEWGHVMVLDDGLARDAYQVERSRTVTWG